MNILVNNSSEPIIIDDEDFTKVKDYTWYLDSKGYPITKIKHKGKRRLIFMHTLISGFKYPDHKDRNPKNCRKQNLRKATSSQNQYNREKYKNRTCHSLFKGVSRSGNRWVAYITVSSKRIYLGTFESELNAAKAYNDAAIKYHKEFAVLNKI